MIALIALNYSNFFYLLHMQQTYCLYCITISLTDNKKAIREEIILCQCFVFNVSRRRKEPDARSAVYAVKNPAPRICRTHSPGN